MTVHRPGSDVLIGRAKDIEGVVLTVSIGPSAVQYQVAWWSGSERKAEWLNDYEVHSTESTERIKIGFRNE